MRAEVSTQVAWLRSAAERKVAALSSASRPPQVSVRVDGGLMQGAVETYEVSELRIGSAPDCDVVLLDDGILPHHLTLRMIRSPFGVLAEAVVLGAITLNGDSVEPGDRPVALRLPLSVGLGGTVLSLSGQADARPPINRTRLLISGLAVVCLISGLVLAMPLLQLATRPAPTTQLVQPEAEATIAKAVTTDFPARMTAELDRLDLSQHVAVQLDDTNSALIQGRVPAGKWAAWRAFTEWYDRQAGAPVLVQTVTRAEELTTLKPVAMVRLADPAQIYFLDGETRAVGDALQDGWVIESITESGIVLKRGDDSTEITF